MRDVDMRHEASVRWVESRPAVVEARTAFESARKALCEFTAREPREGERAADYFAAHCAERDGVERAYDDAFRALSDARAAASREFVDELASAGLVRSSG